LKGDVHLAAFCVPRLRLHEGMVQATRGAQLAAIRKLRKK